MSEHWPYPEGDHRAYRPRQRHATSYEMEAAARLFQQALPLDAGESVLGERDEDILAPDWGGLVHHSKAASTMIVSGGEVIAATVAIPYSVMDPTGVETSQDDPERTAYIYGVAVDDGNRGAGYGYDVMTATLSNLKALGYTHAIMDCKDAMWHLMESYYNPTGAIVSQDEEPIVRWDALGPQMRCELDLALATS